MNSRNSLTLQGSEKRSFYEQKSVEDAQFSKHEKQWKSNKTQKTIIRTFNIRFDSHIIKIEHQCYYQMLGTEWYCFPHKIFSKKKHSNPIESVKCPFSALSQKKISEKQNRAMFVEYTSKWKQTRNCFRPIIFAACVHRKYARPECLLNLLKYAFFEFLPT